MLNKSDRKYKILKGASILKAKRFSGKDATCINKETEELVKYLKENKYLVSDAIEKVFCQIDRGNFAKDNAYDKDPAYINEGATLSRPKAHIRALEGALQKFKDTNSEIKILDVGSGSGYLTLAFSLLYPKSKVYGIEHIDKLVKDSLENIKKKKEFGELLNKRIFIEVGDGRKGMEKEQPFDYIHSGASSESIPKILFDQLKPDGRLCLPLGKNNDQYITYVDKTSQNEQKITKDIKEPYVSLQDKKVQIERGRDNTFVKDKKRINK